MMRHFVFAALLLGSEFSLAQSVQVVTSRPTECATIAISYNGVPRTPSAKGYWIGLAEAGSAVSEHLFRYKYIPGSTSDGVVELSTRGLLADRSYEVRLYDDWGRSPVYRILDSEPFTVGARRCSLPNMDVQWFGSLGVPMMITARGLVSSATNWVAIVPAGQYPHKYVLFKYIPDARQGIVALDLDSLPPGDYRLDLHEDWAGTKEYFIYDSYDFTVF